MTVQRPKLIPAVAGLRIRHNKTRRAARIVNNA
jgi:hypothetical protein